jgi:hypothetical protein
MTSSEPRIVACVLRTGGVYDADYVNKLANAVARNLTIPYRFVCLSNVTEGFNENVHEVVPLKHDFQGWWSKVELFRRDLYVDSQWFFFDLDTVILDNIDDIVGANHCFTTLDDFYREGHIGSGVMAWKQRWFTRIYEDFIENPQRAINSTMYGDQEWIQNKLESWDTFQARFPNAMVSFKKDCVKTATDVIVPGGAKVMCFHGTPKPHEVQLITVTENWK